LFTASIDKFKKVRLKVVSKSLDAFRRCTNFYKTVYVGDGDDAVAGLSGACCFPDQLDGPGLVPFKTNYFHLYSGIYVATELYA